MALLGCRIVVGRDCGWTDEAVAVGNVGDVGKIGVVDNAGAVRNGEGVAAGDTVSGLTGHKTDDVSSIEKGAALLTTAARTHNVLVDVVVPSVEDARLGKNGTADDGSQSSKYGDVAVVGLGFHLERAIGCTVVPEIEHMDANEDAESVVAQRWDARLIVSGTAESAHDALEVRVLHSDVHSHGILAHCRSGCSNVAVAPSHCSSACYTASVVVGVLISHTLPSAGRSSKAH